MAAIFISSHQPNNMLYSSSSSSSSPLLQADMLQNTDHGSYESYDLTPSIPFAVSDYMASEEALYNYAQQGIAGELESHSFPAEETGESGGDSPMASAISYESSGKKIQIGGGCRIGFRTKSQDEILDDGYKWRKYGKKLVKNSPNPRNYYKCSTEGCSVKKRVERDREDPRYVITTYDGVHNHPVPGAICYVPHPSSSTWNTPYVQQPWVFAGP